MLLNIAIGSLMMLITTAIHASFMMMTLRMLRARAQSKYVHSSLNHLIMAGGSVLLMFVASIIEACLWATTFVMLGAIKGVEPALYFSTVTFTTLGYGDIVLDPQWRLLASLEAANGIIMFGWTTAVVVAVVQRVYSTTKA